METEYSFLDLFPGYLQSMTIDLIIDSITILIIVLLMVQYFRRKHRGYELTIFFRMCVMNMIMVVTSVVFDVFPVFSTVNENSLLFISTMRFIVSWLANKLFSIVILIQWLLYVEFTLHKSKDLIRRRYPFVMIPFIVSVVMYFASIPMVLWENSPFDVYLLQQIISIVTEVIQLLYIIFAYIILYIEKKRSKIPAYIRLTPTAVCMILGFIAHRFITNLPVFPLFFAIALLFTDFYMYRRLRNIDPKTGLFNKKYIPVLIRLSKKHNLLRTSIIRFNVPADNSDKMASILKQWAPEQSKTITLENGTFLLVSEALHDSLAERFIYLISEHAKKEGIEVDSGFETTRDATMDVLLQKYA